jgi:hypothetical protein
LFLAPYSRTVLPQARLFLRIWDAWLCITGKPKTAFLTRKWSLSEGTRVFVYIALYLTLLWFMPWLKAEHRAHV